MKKFYQSKTIWLGIATSILSILTLLQGEAWVQEYPRLVAGLGATVGVMTIVLRFFTNIPIRCKNE